MSDCLFCQIVAKQIPADIVYEDDLFLGFLDIRPLNPGHVLLIPKTHYLWVDEVPEFGQYWAVAHQIALAAKIAVSANFITYFTFGMGVPHAHIHIIPRFFGDGHQHGLDTRLIQDISPDYRQKICSQIINNLTL